MRETPCTYDPAVGNSGSFRPVFGHHLSNRFDLVNLRDAFSSLETVLVFRIGYRCVLRLTKRLQCCLRGHGGGWPAGRAGEREKCACETVAGWIRAPRHHLDAIDEPERPPTAGADTVGERLPAIEKVVAVDYTPTVHCLCLSLGLIKIDLQQRASPLRRRMNSKVPTHNIAND